MQLTEQEAEEVLGLIRLSSGWYSPIIPKEHMPLTQRILAEFPALKEKYSSFSAEEQAKIVTPDNIEVGKLYLVWYPYDENHQLSALHGDKVCVYEGIGQDYYWDNVYCFKEVKTGRQLARNAEDLPRLVRPYEGGKDAVQDE